MQFPLIASLVSSCWDQDNNKRPTFSEIYSAISDWDGESSIVKPDGHLFWTLRTTTELSKFEEGVVNEGVRSLLRKKRSDEGVFNYEAKANTFFSIKKMNHFPWEVCELVFDWQHPERQREGWCIGDGARRVVERINEHHHIVMFTWEKRTMGIPIFQKDFYFHLIWHEVSQGTYIIILKSLTNKFSQYCADEVLGSRLKVNVLSTVMVQQGLDGVSSNVSFTTKMIWDQGIASITNDDDHYAQFIFLSFLNKALDRKKQGDWEKYLDPGYVNPFFDKETGKRFPNPPLESYELVLNKKGKKQLWKVVGKIPLGGDK